MHRLICGFLCAAAFVCPASASDANAVPDFSGIWARTTFGMEFPKSGPGPLRNLARRPNGTSDAFKLVGDYHNPILKPAAAAEVKRRGEISLAGKSYPDLSNECLPLPPPYVLRIQRMQMLQKKDEILILYIQDHQVRHVRLNAQHPAHVMPSWYGDSVGHYEGDTLVVDTVGVKLGPNPIVDLYGTPRSEAMHVVERYRFVSAEEAKAAQDANEKEYGRPATEPVYVDFNYPGKGLEVTFTVDDPIVFTAPWSAAATYRKSVGEWEEIVCAENRNEYYKNGQTPVPRALKPEF